jgi:hypothetical protein
MSVPLLSNARKVSEVGILAVIVLLLVIMPALLYLIGWGVTRYTRKAMAPIARQIPRKGPADRPAAEPAAATDP